jgi:hypothetical protein
MPIEVMHVGVAESFAPFSPLLQACLLPMHTGFPPLQACLLAVHAIRFTHKSPMPIEVMYVGVAESFSPSAAGHLTSYGHVTLIDLLTRLAPELRVDASTILRSFAVKPFAMLASSFDEVKDTAAH